MNEQDGNKTGSPEEVNPGEIQDNSRENWDNPEISHRLRLIVFLQFLAFAISYAIIWYYPHRNEVGNFVWNPETLAPYFFILGGIILGMALLILVLPSMNGKFNVPAILVSSLVCVFAVTIFFRFLVTFIAVTLHATGTLSLPPIDPFPFLKWAKFLIIFIK